MPFFGPWITPPVAGETVSMSLVALMRSNGSSYSDYGGYVASLGQAFSGSGVIGAPVSGSTLEGYLGEDPLSLDGVQLRVSVERLAFTYPSVPPPDPPAGATWEYEHPAGVPVADATVTGTYRINAGVFEELGKGVHILRGVEPVGGWTPSVWMTPAQLGALDVLTAVPYLPIVGSLEQDGPISFTFPEDALDAVVAWDAILEEFIPPTYNNGGNVFFPIPLTASRFYQPPRYRFIHDRPATIRSVQVGGRERGLANALRRERGFQRVI